MASIGDLGLTTQSTVRFQRAAGGKWRVGTPIGAVNKDGSIDIFVDGRIRSIQPDRLEVRSTGPRGGIVWVPLCRQEEAS